MDSLWADHWVGKMAVVRAASRVGVKAVATAAPSVDARADPWGW